MKYFLNVDGEKAVIVPVTDTPIADILIAHTFVMYAGSIFCGRNPESDWHWEGNAGTDAELIRLWAEHTADHIQAEV